MLVSVLLPDSWRGLSAFNLYNPKEAAVRSRLSNDVSLVLVSSNFG